MCLHNVSNRASLIVEDAPALDPEIFSHGDLHALDMVAIPERLQERIRKAEVANVMDRQLPKVMVDAEDRRLLKSRQQGLVELPGRGEVRPERLFDDDAGVPRAPRLPELFDDRSEQCRRNGKVVRRTLGRAELFAELLKSRGVLIVAVHIT